MTPEEEAEEFEELYRATRRDVLAYLLRRVTDQEDAADLLAEVYVVAWRRRSDRPAGSHARPWVFGVARLVLADHARGSVRRREAADGLRRLLQAPPEPALSPVERRADVSMHEALASLGERDRELISLIVWEGLDVVQAAEALGIRPGTARVRLHRARARLRRHPALVGDPTAPPHPAGSRHPSCRAQVSE